MKPEQVWDVDLLNKLANEPRNQEMLGYRDVDLSGFYQRPGNIAIGTKQGVALFAYLGENKWEGHYLFSPELEGRQSIDLAREIITALFTNYGASAILGQIPEENRSSRLITRALGFTPVGTSTSPSGRSCVNYKLERNQWAESLAESSAA